MTTLGLITVLALKARRVPLPGRARTAATALLAMGWMQVNLKGLFQTIISGIGTTLTICRTKK